MEAVQELERGSRLIALNPRREMLAFEALFAMHRDSYEKLSRLIRSQGQLPSEVFKFYRNQISEKLFDELKQYLALKEDISIAISGDMLYPSNLAESQDLPNIFYYRGNVDLANTRSVAVVGARKATGRGTHDAREIAHILVENDYTVVSGLAEGIDTAAISGAFEANGNIIGVIGTPLDVYYPPQNRRLQDRVAKEGLLISQVPFYRYFKEHYLAKPKYFPRRNITMAALSTATVIVEASDTSGTLHQANACIKLGRKLFISADCADNPDVTWVDSFVRAGAILFSSPYQIIEALSEQ